MVDIETMGTGSRSAIIAIAAVEFNVKNGMTRRAFHTNVSLDSSLRAGLELDADTVIWWLQQNEEARMAIAKPDGQSLYESLLQLSDFISSCGKDQIVWGNSARFDLGILLDAYEATGLTAPWTYRDERDVRTLVSINPAIKAQVSFSGTRHNALDDCHYQIQYCSAIWRSIKCSS